MTATRRLFIVVTGIRIFILILILAMGLNSSVMASQGDIGDIPTPDYYPYDFYRLGDVNSDGWCNGGDVSVMTAYFKGLYGGILCDPAKDTNGNGSFNGLDLTYLVTFLKGGPEPINACATTVPDTPVDGIIAFNECVGNPGDTVYVNVFIQGDSLYGLNIPFAYNNNNIESIFLSSFDPSFIEWDKFVAIHPNLPPGNNDTLNTASIMAFPLYNGYNFVNFPSLAHGFTLGVVISQTSPGGLHPLIPEADTIFGPPRFHYHHGGNWSLPLFGVDAFGGITGLVTDNLANPIGNVEVTAFGAIGGMTDEFGIYHIIALGGTYDVMFSHPYYRDTTVSSIVVVSADTTVLDMIMEYEEPGAIGGTVFDTLAAPLEGVLVNIIGTNYWDTTDVFGSYLLNGLNPELHNVRFARLGFKDTSATGIEAFSGQTTILNMTMARQPTGVKIRSEYKIIQNAFDAALDLHFKVWQKEDPIEIISWEIAVSDFDSVHTQRGYQPPPFTDTNINHAIDVDCTEGFVLRGTVVTITVTWWLTSWNSMNLSGIRWTDDGTLLTSEMAAPDFGWTIGYPQTTRQDSCMHEFTMSNYDTSQTLYIKEMGFYGTMDYEYSLLDIDPVLFEPVAGLDSTLTPGDSSIGQIPTEGGCAYVTGDVNGSGSYNGLDITYGVNFLKGGDDPLCADCPLCPDWHYCGDVNGSCSYNGLDITYGVNYLKGGDAPISCTDCPPPGGITTLEDCLIGGHIYGKYKLYDPTDPTFSLEATFDHEVVEAP